MRLAICHITDKGRDLARRLEPHFSGCSLFDLRGKGQVSRWTGENFHSFDGHVYIMSLGIVYRVIAPHIGNKHTDPAVVVIDDAGRFSIAALSGHEGGANRLAARTAGVLGTQPVITTASETNRKIILGLGCRRGVEAEAVEGAVKKALKEVGLEPDRIRQAVSVDIKRDERGLREALDRMDIPLLFIDSRTIENSRCFDSVSEAARRQLGLPGVSEPCALLGGRNTKLIMPRRAYGGVTIALAEEDAI